MAITRTADTDDDGSGLTGTVRDNAWKQELYDQIDAEFTATASTGVQTTTSTGTVNNFALTAGIGFLRCNNAALLTLTGIAAGDDGQLLVITSVGAGQVDLTHQSGSSTAANRLINIATSAVTSLAAGSGSALLKYDATTARWRMVSHEQGAWITPTFSAGNFSGVGALTWTVGSGSVTAYAYRLDGRTLHVRLSLSATSNTTGGTPNGELKVTIPGGFTSVGDTHAFGVVQNNGGTLTTTRFYVATGLTYIQIYTDVTHTGNWANGTNNNQQYGSLAFEVT